MKIENLDFLLHAGRLLDAHPRNVDWPDWFCGKHADIHAETTRDFLIEALLKVRSKTRGLVALRPNRAQAEYSHKCSRRNIVLKARQVGVTTYIAARFFVQTITQPGTVTLQVAHDQESAEDIFRIVHRFRENLPEEMPARRAAHLARQRPANRIPAVGQRVPGGDGGGRKRGPGDDRPQFALFGGRPLARESAGNADLAARCGPGARRHCAGVNAQGRRRRVLR